MSDPKATVLILDDDKFLADMYSIKFASEGYDVHACLSVDDAIAAVRGGVSPDVILFDIALPQSDGFTFLQQLDQEHLAQGAIRIALTNQNNDEERKRAETLGAVRFIVKASMLPSEVAALVGEELAKRHPTEPNVH